MGTLCGKIWSSSALLCNKSRFKLDWCALSASTGIRMLLVTKEMHATSAWKGKKDAKYLSFMACLVWIAWTSFFIIIYFSLLLTCNWDSFSFLVQVLRDTSGPAEHVHHDALVWLQQNAARAKVMEARRQSGLSLDAELENQIKNESSEVRAIPGKSNGASPDPAFVAVQGSRSSSPQGGLSVPMGWLCSTDFGSCHLLLGAKSTFWHLCTDWQNMTTWAIRGQCEHFAEPRELVNSGGTCGCWEDALRDSGDAGWCWKMGEVLQKESKAFAEIFFFSAREGLRTFDLLYKISLNIFHFAV